MDELTTPKLPKRISKLDELAHNLWWSWHTEARNLYKSLDRPLWKLTGHNPVK
jgi:starch phosphorylase